MSTYYVTQEKAMAPGIADGWPEIIKAPHTKNGRLKKLSVSECVAIDEVLDSRFRVDVKKGIGVVIPSLVNHSIWFQVEPLPNNWYRITVKEEARHILMSVIAENRAQKRTV